MCHLHDSHYSHCGGNDLRLKQAITPETPLGNGTDRPAVRDLVETLLKVTDSETATEAVRTAGRIETIVEPDPIAVAVSRETVLQSYLDYPCHEAFYEAAPSFTVTASRALWFGLEYDCHRIVRPPTVAHSPIRTVEWYEEAPADEGELYGTFRGLKTVAGDITDRSVFTPAEGLDYLEGTLRAGTPAAHSVTVSRQDGGIRLDDES